ncbi:MAG: PhzF family isomerase [Anaerolineae bacterium]|nr:PhzF family isomerase [Anaerolineae bacterium]
MRKYTLYQVDAFTEMPFTGNPAGVVWPADGLSESEMQSIARELNNSETAFIFASESPDYDVHIRYFTPAIEVPICGHATIAAHVVRATETHLASVKLLQKTKVGILPVEVNATDSGYEVIMTQGAIEFVPPFEDSVSVSICKALGLTHTDLDPRCPVQIVSTGHSKVMVGLRDVEKLAHLIPDHQRLRHLSAEIGCNGYFVFGFDAPDSGTLTCGRMFAPAIGITEDPVTGNANGPLGAYLVQHGLVQHDGRQFCFTARQGVHIGRPGSMKVRVTIQDGRPEEVQISGRAVIVFKAELTL